MMWVQIGSGLAFGFAMFWLGYSCGWTVGRDGVKGRLT